MRTKATVTGADGCRAGWVAASRAENGAIQAHIFDSAAALLNAALPNQLVVDVPIGLPESGARTADRMARETLGWPRRTSVFSAPARSLLGAADWQEATRLRRELEGKGMARQAWNIVPKIREMDEAVRGLDPQQERVFEGHPEVSFTAMRGAPIQEKKKGREGRLIRTALIEAYFGEGVVRRLWANIHGKGVAHDDLLDALAMLWTAERVAAHKEERLPQVPERDGLGLRMEIVV